MIDIKKKNGTVICSVNADTLVGLRLYDVNLTGAYLADANLSGANLDFYQTLLSILKTQVTFKKIKMLKRNFMVLLGEINDFLNVLRYFLVYLLHR